VIQIEFQPSSFSRGSYLNVGASWLFSEEDHLAFDVGHRVEGFTGYTSDEQFTPVAEELAERAAKKIREYRVGLSTLAAARELARPRRSKTADWPEYHAGFLAGLAGDLESTRSHFNRLIEDASAFPWGPPRADRLRRLLPFTSDRAGFRKAVSAIVSRTRAMNKLKKREVVFPAS
jgi:hypothetical protein